MKTYDDGIGDFLEWCESLDEDELNAMADEVDGVIALAIAGMDAVDGFEPFLCEYLPTTPTSFMAPLFNVSQDVQ
jgi:hypothetical protein